MLPCINVCLQYEHTMKKSLIQLNLAVILWGFTGVLGRAISLDAPVLVWYRMLFTALFMAAILTYRRQWVPVSRADMWRLVSVGCLMGLHWVAFYGSIKFTNASIALVCLSTGSIFTSFLDPLINKGKFDIKEVMLGLLALGGVYTIYRLKPPDTGTAPVFVNYGLGIISGIIAAALSSIFTMFNKKVAHKYPSRIMVFYEMTTGWIFLCLLMPVVFYYLPDTRFIPHSPSLLGKDWYLNDWIWLIVLSLCCTVWAQSLALNALKKLSSFIVTLSVNLEPVYGIILAFIFYKEDQYLGKGFYIGVGLIMLSVVLQVLRMIKPRSSKGYVEEKGGID